VARPRAPSGFHSLGDVWVDRQTDRHDADPNKERKGEGRCVPIDMQQSFWEEGERKSCAARVLAGQSMRA